MTLSPKIASHFNSSTTNRGVEAKETEIANIRLDMDVSSSSAAAGAPAPPAPPLDDTGSYIQVVVHKHRRASSPLPPPPPPAAAPADDDGAAGDVLLPACPQLPPISVPINRCGCGGGRAPAAGGDTGTASVEPPPPPKKQKTSVWKTFGSFSNDTLGWDDDGPECVEVYYFERGGECLWGGAGRLEAVAQRRVLRPAARALAALLVAPRLAAALPLAAALGVARCALLVARDAVAGAVHTAADYALKPALALAFNALMQPPLVFVGNVLRAARDALRPLWLAAGDALEPAARLLSAARLVTVHAPAPTERCCCYAAAHGARPPPQRPSVT